jgi:hypothetical protein
VANQTFEKNSPGTDLKQGFIILTKYISIEETTLKAVVVAK